MKNMADIRIQADYWKSQAKKYCDFCKCWIADNKPSVEFHEKGKRHQENVAKRLKTISKKSRQNERENLKFDVAIKQMEAAALEAYRKDIEHNADWTAKSITKKLEETNSVLAQKKVWNEAKSKDGKVYYWNIITNETVWEAPKEGFLTIAEQQMQKFEETKQQLNQIDKHRQVEGKLKLQQIKQEEMEERARAFREKMKERRVAEEPEPSSSSSSGPIIPPGKTEPYGQWKVIEEKPKIDFQLPKQEYYEVPVVEEEQPPPVKEFKEKTIESLGLSNESTTFKKRKFGNNAKRNVRQRLDVD